MDNERLKSAVLELIRDEFGGFAATHPFLVPAYGRTIARVGRLFDEGPPPDDRPCPICHLPFSGCQCEPPF